jgi:hypothetical protein
MSDSQLSLLLVLLAIAYAIYRFIKKRNDNANAEQVRALLRPLIEEYTKVGLLNAAKDRYFSSAVEDDTTSGRPSEEIEINKQRRLEAEEQGRCFILAAKTLEAVVEQPTKAEMIALMERYMVEFGRDMAEQARLSNCTADTREKERIDIHGLQAAFVVALLKKLLAEIKQK